MSLLINEAFGYHYLALERYISKKCLLHSLGLDLTISHNWINVANFTKDHIPSPLWMEMSKVGDLLLSCALIVSREVGCSPPRPFTSANISLFGPESCFLTFCHPFFFHPTWQVLLYEIKQHQQQNKSCAALGRNDFIKCSSFVKILIIKKQPYISSAPTLLYSTLRF